MKHKKQILIFSFIYVLIYGSYAIGTTQFVPYLTSLGYTAVERGLLFSSIAIVTIISQMIFGLLSDKYNTVKRLYIMALLVFAVASYLFYDIQVKSFLLHLVVLSLLGGFFNLSMGMGDSWILEAQEEVRKVYSFIRAFGSLGWAIGSIAVSYIINRLGYYALGALVMLIAAIALGLALLLKDASKRYVVDRKAITKEDLKELCSNKAYLLVVFILFLLICVNTFSVYTVIDKLVFIGATNRDIGILWTIKAIVEVPIFFIGTFLLRKFKAKGLLKISAFMVTVQFLLWGLSTKVNTMLVIASMQIFTYPLIIMASKTLIDELSSDSCKSTGQLLAMSIYSGLSGLIIPYLSGILSATFTINFTLYFAAFLGGVAYILTFFVKKRFCYRTKNIIKNETT